MRKLTQKKGITEMTVKKNYAKINDKFDERLEYMTKKHNKVTSFRFDVHFPKDRPNDGTNKYFSKLLKRVKEPLTKNGNELHYVWCREQDTSENPHYHFAGLVNGNYTQRVDGILQEASNNWKEITGSPKNGLIDHCNRFRGEKVPTQIRIDRPSSAKEGEELIELRRQFEAKKDEARKRAHYLGKEDQKGDVPRRVREYGASELRKRSKR
jgi:hypothetical protein